MVTGHTEVTLPSKRVPPDPFGRRLGPPPRQLSPPLRDWALKRFTLRIRWRLVCTVGAATMLGGASFVVSYFTSADETWMLWLGVSWIVLDIGVLIGIILLMRADGLQRGRQLRALLECGTVRSALVIANQVDYAARVNGVPRLAIALSIEGQPIEIRTFDSNDAALFQPGAMIPVLYDESIPDMVFPTSRIPPL